MKRAMPKASISVGHAGSKKIVTVTIKGVNKLITVKKTLQTK